MLGRLEKLQETKYMTPSSAHRDGGPFWYQSRMPCSAWSPSWDGNPAGCIVAQVILVPSGRVAVALVPAANSLRPWPWRLLDSKKSKNTTESLGSSDYNLSFADVVSRPDPSRTQFQSKMNIATQAHTWVGSLWYWLSTWEATTPPAMATPCLNWDSWAKNLILVILTRITTVCLVSVAGARRGCCRRSLCNCSSAAGARRSWKKMSEKNRYSRI